MNFLRRERFENLVFSLCDYLFHSVNADSIGEYFRVNSCTTIASKTNKDDRPVIGNNVQLGGSVIIIGGIKIGNNVTIGAGSVVVKDIPNNCIIAGNPAKIIRYIE